MPGKKSTQSRLSSIHLGRNIQGSRLIYALQKHALGEIDLTTSQVRSAEILLNKILPNVSSVTLKGDDDAPVRTVTKIEIVAPGLNDDSKG